MRPIELEDDHFHDECGVFGVFGAPEASNLTYLGLHALQHRGQEAAGIVSTDGQRLFVQRATGLVQDVFTTEVLSHLPGDRAIGHVRYSTAGGSHLKNAQPLGVDYARGSLAVAHNGNLTNHEALREQLEARGSIYQTASDTESIVHLIAMSKKDDLRQRIAEALKQVEGAYSLLFLTERELIAVRDPRAIRPLCLGEMPSGSGVAHVVASESTAFDLIGARKVRDIEPGEMLIISADGVRSEFPFAQEQRKLCI